MLSFFMYWAQRCLSASLGLWSTKIRDNQL